MSFYLCDLLYKTVLKSLYIFATLEVDKFLSDLWYTVIAPIKQFNKYFFFKKSGKKFYNIISMFCQYYVLKLNVLDITNNVTKYISG